MAKKRSKREPEASAVPEAPAPAVSIAKALNVRPEVVLHRQEFAVSELADLRPGDRIGDLGLGDQEFELVVGERVVGHGRMVDDGAGSYFEISRLSEEEHG